MSDRGTAWSVTLNMKNVSRERCEGMIEQAKNSNWGVRGQIEEGKEGTPHYQLLIRTPQVRFSAVKRVFPTAHIEKARNVKALESYVHKEEGRLEVMKTIERKFVQFPEVRKKFFQWVIEEGHEQVSDYDRKLSLWDEFISLSIRERIECDVIGVNPQYRSIIQKYWAANVDVAQEDKVSRNSHMYSELPDTSIDDRQTDRQTANILVSDDSITHRDEAWYDREDLTKLNEEEDWEEQSSTQDETDESINYSDSESSQSEC